MKRPFKQEEISGALSKLVSELRLSGKSFLPSERDLGSALGASRETVRRVLEDLERKGVLLKGSKGRALAIAPKTGPRLVFAASGVGVVGNMTWNRLWNSLSSLSARTDLDVSLRLMPWNSGAESLESLLESPPAYLVVVDAPGPKAMEALLSLKGHSTLIAVDENMASSCDYAVHFDNFEAGRMAARSLLDAGYRNPCYLGWRHTPPYLPFERRAEGFLSVLKESGLSADAKRLVWIKPSSPSRASFIRGMIRRCDEIASSSFDSVFCHSDEDIDFAYEILSEAKRIPEELGIFTVHGCGMALSQSPQISCAGQGEAAAAEALLGLAEALSRGESPKSRTIKIKPEAIDAGTTLRK